MKPKEKAKDLFNKYFEHVEAFSYDQQNNNAKKCALICVDEILTYDEFAFKYWNEVKTELEKL